MYISVFSDHSLQHISIYDINYWLAIQIKVIVVEDLRFLSST